MSNVNAKSSSEMAAVAAMAEENGDPVCCAKFPARCSLVRSTVAGCHRVKSACVLVLLGTVMLVMGSIVHIEKFAIQSDNSDYAYIAANALLGLGVAFVSLSLGQVCCCAANSCCYPQSVVAISGQRHRDIDDLESAPGAVSASLRRQDLTIHTICSTITEAPPKYGDVITTKEPGKAPPPYAVIMSCSDCEPST